MEFYLDLNVITGGIVVASVIALGGMLLKTVRSIDRLTNLLGDSKIPESLLGRLYVAEGEIRSMREWLLSNGYDRRLNKVDK
jgi:hypothetical protein